MNELSTSEKIKYSAVDIAKFVKKELKKLYLNCKFSIGSKYYSGGMSISCSLMESDFQVIEDFDKIPEETLFSYEHNSNYKREELKDFQSKKYHQLNQYTLRQDYNLRNWCNGVFLTKEGHEMFKKVVECFDQYNWNHSDISIDYFDVHFYLDLEIGKWDKDYIYMEKKL